MPLIEGIGDEVLQFVVMTCMIGMTLAAWMSTNARPSRYRTLLVMRAHNPHPHPVTVTIRTGVPNVLYTNASGRGSSDTVTLSASFGPEHFMESGPIIPLQEMDSIVDADMALFENNRLHFYRRLERVNLEEETPTESAETPVSQQESDAASNDQIREMDSIVSAMEADITSPLTQESNSSVPTVERVTENNDSLRPEGGTSSEEAQSDSEPGDDPNGKILIRLKYLNDTLKDVEGSLDEPLKDFKWRHFSRELSGAFRVRLIHRGRVLADDGASLRQHGLTHRAVVHALVHPPRTQRSPPTEEPVPPPSEGTAERPERGWDLENILMTLVSVALTVVWFFRCEYSNMFTASASVALFGLTVFYSVAIFGLYLSDTFAFDRQPLPTDAGILPPPNN